MRKYYDKLWYKETANNFYNAGINDDNFIMVTNSNRECKVAVKTPWGSISERITLNEIDMQGTVLTPLKCAVQIDSLGKDFIKDKKVPRYSIQVFISCSLLLVYSLEYT